MRPLNAVTRGPAEVREHLVAFCKAAFPAQLEASREAWGMTKVQLPDPVKYSPYELPALDVLPAIAVNVGSAASWRRVDYDPAAGECYEVRYTCRLYGWVKHKERTPTERIRDDYATALTSLLLATPGLGGGGAFRLEETTMAVTYSEPAAVKGDRFVAGASLAFDLWHRESVRRVPLGDAQSIGVAVTVMPERPEHPGLV